MSAPDPRRTCPNLLLTVRSEPSDNLPSMTGTHLEGLTSSRGRLPTDPAAAGGYRARKGHVDYAAAPRLEPSTEVSRIVGRSACLGCFTHKSLSYPPDKLLACRGLPGPNCPAHRRRQCPAGDCGGGVWQAAIQAIPKSPARDIGTIRKGVMVATPPLMREFEQVEKFYDRE